MLQILLHRFLRDVARTPGTLPDGPEVSPPVAFLQPGILLLQDAGGAPFHPLDQIRQRPRWRVLDVHVDMIFADHALENPHVFGIADWQE